jgi:dipeptidyl aminopeptidase/acylaminoacyl peptidase
MLLATGTDDTTVLPRNTRNLATRLRRFHSAVEEKYYPGTGHVGIILSLAPGFRGRTSLREDMLDFIRRN